MFGHDVWGLVFLLVFFALFSLAFVKWCQWKNRGPILHEEAVVVKQRHWSLFFGDGHYIADVFFLTDSGRRVHWTAYGSITEGPYVLPGAKCRVSYNERTHLCQTIQPLAHPDVILGE